jgi:flagellar biogenesis protein FliO
MVMQTILAVVALLCLIFVVPWVNKRLLAHGPILGGRIQPRGTNRFPIVPTNESQKEHRRSGAWGWYLVDALLLVAFLIWLLRK